MVGDHRGRRVRAALIGLVVAALALVSGPATAQRTITPQPAPAATTGICGDSWAVIVGINAYRTERVPKLRYAVSDARSVESALAAQGFRRDRIMVLTDADATKARIEEALGDRLRQQAGRNDRVLVFFAGHGRFSGR
ncbi:MAG: caspase family protein [Candidatus Rokubacteria bacterium]|nr:caspase family protein [Candidatus Rokubacteria bacterium]